MPESETRIDGYTLVVEFTEREIAASLEAAQGMLHPDKTVFLLSVQHHPEGDVLKARLCFQNVYPEAMSLPVSNIDAVLEKCHIISVERRIVDAKWSLPVMRRPGDLVPLCKLLPNNCIVAELGSFSGESAVQFRQSGKVSLIICVDNWQGGYDAGDEASMSSMATVKEAFDYRMSDPKLLGQCRAFHMTTLEAAPLIKDELLDMVYVDADHRYFGVKADLEAWIPKVKRGGIIAGHDWHLAHFSVVKAVIDVIGKPDGVFTDSSWFKIKE